MNQANPLDNLRDIHLPEAISAWPPAPGWWILAILLLSVVFWISWKLWIRHQQKYLLRVSMASLTELNQQYQQHQNPQLLIQNYSSLLRRIALARFPRAKVASLTGTSWLAFLDDTAQINLFNSELGQLLINLPYQKPDTEVPQLEELTEAIKLWIQAVNSEQNQIPQSKFQGSSND